MPLEDPENCLSPMSIADFKRIENSGFSNLDQHYLRLIAHCLGCFKSIACESAIGPLPSKVAVAHWLSSQSKELIDESFANVLLEQFASAAAQLEQIADHFGLDVPIIRSVFSVIKGTIGIDDAITSLLSRPLKSEIDH